MATSLELKRTKEKLRILEETPNIGWVIGDIIDIMSEHTAEKKDRVVIIEDLKWRYKQYIEQYNKPISEQTELDF